MGFELRRIPWDPGSWNDTLAGHPAAEVYHSAEWLEYLAATQGAKPIIAEVHADGACVGHFVGATVRRFGLSVLGSPLPGWGTQMMGFLLKDGVDRLQAIEALRPFYRELGCAHVEVGDRVITPADARQLRYEVGSATMSVVDLTKSEDSLLAQMHSRTRTYARRASRNGLRVELGGGEEFAEEYFDQLEDVFRSSGLTPTYGVDRVRHLIRALEPSGQIALIRILDPEGRRVGTSITIGRNGRVTLWGLAFYRQYARLHPVEPLQWETIRHWRERGFRIYNLAGSEPSKAKFTPDVEHLVLLHHSRYPALDYGRRALRQAVRLRQRFLGGIQQRRVRAGESATTG